MDKGQLSAEKLMNSDPRDCDGYNKDDVAVITKKEKLQELSTSSDIIPTQTNVAINKTTSRGKEPTEKKHDGKTVQEPDTEELLGSVTTYNCHGTRTSARVIQKMRQDQQTRPITPPPSERDAGRKDERSANQKTPSQVRANRPTWSNVERNHFFDALNEFGKDFEAIGNFINTKLKRRSPATDISFKSKDQVRQHYYQTYHKICKYIRFSEEVRKPVQELYTLINYGEMRRKLQFVTDKHFMKLRNLIYHGHISVRCKGKNIRIKTPSCKALRRLNQLDDSLEDIRLPSKIEVIISPATMEAFGRVQTIAQNPRCRTTVPLHKKLVNFIKTFQSKWRSMEVRIAEEAKLITTHESLTTQQQQQQQPNTHLFDASVHDNEMCFLPKPGVTIHRPLLSITEYLSSVNICLTAYEERMGVKIKGESLNTDRCAATAATNPGTNPQSSISNTNISSAPNKRVRTESGSEKRSPEQLKKTKQIDNSLDNLLTAVEEAPLLNDSFQNNVKNESSGDELSDELQELLSDANQINSIKDCQTISENQNPPPNPQPLVPTAPTSDHANTNCMAQLTASAGRAKRGINSKTSRSVFKPLLNDDVIQRIRNGWTSSTAGDITIGDLYVVFGHDSRLQLDYYWMPGANKTKQMSNNESQSSATLKQSLITISKQTNTFVSTSSEDEKLQNTVQSSDLSNKLKQLLLIANLNERMRRRPCTCDRTYAAKVKLERDLMGRTFIANKSFVHNGVNSSTASDSSGSVFRQPIIPVRRTAIDPVKQLTTLTRQKMSRQVLVQRLLLPSNGSVNTTGQLNSNTIHTITHQDTSTAKPSNETSAANKVVPWNRPKKCDTPIISSTTISSPAMQNQIATTTQNPCNTTTTFLNSLTLNDIEELPETSASHQPQYKDLENQNDDDITDSPLSGIQSVDSAFDESSNTSFLNGLTPMHLLRETSSNSRWLEDNINDFSLTSLLGHLDEINSSRDMLDPSSNLSVISESSVDYMHKFQEIKALLQSQEKD